MKIESHEYLLFCFLIVLILISITTNGCGSESSNPLQELKQPLKQTQSISLSPPKRNPCSFPGTMVTEEINGIKINRFVPPDLSAMEVEVGILADKENAPQIEEILFDGKNIWRPNGIIDNHPLPVEIIIHWYRPDKKRRYEVSTRLATDYLAPFFCPPQDGGSNPILTILFKADNEVMILRTYDFDLSADLLVLKEISATEVPIKEQH